ncbi:MAG: N-6 DNA methylase [Candidatus Moranbacteria bacterium]|nr:N-6 DNA methylase [Candidatus Moranbacteria bacterium]
MLDATTKRKIDSARQILVGKVPDPKAQVEQITTALVYKFMDDMDKESQELGGEAKFFTNGFEKYSWTKLLDKRLSGQERLDLYVQAITNMSKNPHIPQLFRDIFKDAFLPYRDPETLSLFLKEVDNFSYDHSEDLGNAFEYLLSVLGSQGDAGQFRTPRHIIDFIVAVVDPKKNETILDPACGTAGFLISAFKHIRKHNSSNFKAEKEATEEKLPEGETIAETVLSEKAYRGDKLTPSEKEKLMRNFVGYDISPDMVKLSLVNMYLHGFPEPKIYEYDTLTSEKHWDEQFDVIMANPPFMSPKGGIRPHKRFSVQASRSEVLFVDYILEHLNLKGRAGIIVPEGIIFKTENAYKQLRQMLIEVGLFAVVSLPPGVFNPYSGVKTSILLFDNQLAKKTDEILFLKIENDGFDLGAQRRKIDKNDLPEALEVLEAWKQSKKKDSDLALWVKKEKIAESGDYNLTGERYKEIEVRKNQKWPEVELGEVCEILDSLRRPVKKADRKEGKYPYYGATGILDYVDDYIFDEKLVLVGEDGAKWESGEKSAVIAEGKYWVNNHAHALRPDRKKLLDEYLVPILNKMDLSGYVTGVTVPKLNQAKLKSIKIPLPPLEVQKEIVEQIEVKQNAINHAKEIIKNLERERRYFGQELRKLEDVEWVELGKVMTLEYGKPLIESDRKEGEYPVFGSNGIVGYHDEYLVKGPFIVVGRKGTAGAVTYSDKSGFPIDTTFYVELKEKSGVDLKYLFRTMQTLNLGELNNQAGVPGLNRNDAYKVKIPLPSLEIQKQLVAEAKKEEEIIASNHRLIDLMERKIGQVLAEI